MTRQRYPIRIVRRNRLTWKMNVWKRFTIMDVIEREDLLRRAVLHGWRLA